MNYFEDLARLLEAEQDYDRAQHEDLLQGRGLQERKAQGVTWYPIAITQTEMGRGDYLSISIQKTNDLEEGHKFRFGMPVALFSNHDPQADRLQGIIAYVSRDSMRISLRVDELPDWTRRGKLGIDLLFDENSYKEMHTALHTAMALVANVKEGTLVRQLIGQDHVEHQPSPTVYVHPDLNESQQQAVSQILAMNPVQVVHGPPGTGKTTTLIHAVKALWKQQKQQILLVAPSNTAVDVLTERLDAAGVSVVRIGNPVKVSAHLQALTLDAKLDAHPANREVKTLEKQARAYTDMAHKYKRNFGKAERDQRKALFDEARKLRKEIDKVQDYMTTDILNKAEVITATLVGANQYMIKDRTYETVIIDEAAQALEPACWIPILKAKQVILAGDHQQLPPTVKSSAKSNQGLYITLLEKLVKLYPAAVSLLKVQYRMHAQIMRFPSQYLYQDALIAADTVADWRLLGDEQPVLFIDTAGAGFDELIEDDAISNVEEATFLGKHLRSLLLDLSSQYNATDFPSIGVVTPYRRQSLVLKECLGQDETIQERGQAIQVHTIDSFQGQEKDIIYISLTRSNAQQQIGFLADVRRMNVAMTRAKKKLVVIGDSSTIGLHPFYKQFIDYVTDLGGYHSVWEWDLA